MDGGWTGRCIAPRRYNARSQRSTSEQIPQGGTNDARKAPDAGAEKNGNSRKPCWKVATHALCGMRLAIAQVIPSTNDHATSDFSSPASRHCPAAMGWRVGGGSTGIVEVFRHTGDSGGGFPSLARNGTHLAARGTSHPGH